jgi:prepilin-type N-terminal cleavage/methylation domain-containing protein
MKRQYQSGFTLIEIVLVFVLVAILIAITTPLVVDTLRRVDLTSAHESLYNALNRAQQLSQSQTNGQVWGVCLDNINKRYIIVAGTCSARVTTYDEIISISSNININIKNGDTIQFDAIKGNSNSWNSITLTNGGFSKSIVIYNQIINKDPASLTPNTSGS